MLRSRFTAALALIGMSLSTQAVAAPSAYQASSLRRPDWIWSSFPVDPSGLPRSPLLSDHARIAWYNAPGVYERDLNPMLTKDQGADNGRVVLELNVLGPDTSRFTARTWAGITRSRARSGEDLSATQYVEIWVNDKTPDHSLTHARLHYDLGAVSEDAFWDASTPPNGRLDTEDKNQDTRLDRSDDPVIDEDTGLDGLHDAEEPGYDPLTNLDPHADDYRYTNGSADYSKINGTERNGLDDPYARPDTEDLDLDGRLDTENDYYEATIDLADTVHVAVDVARDFAGDPDVTPTNGWRLFRIPVEAFTTYGRPSWSSVQHERLWLDGMTGPTDIQIGGVQLTPTPISELPRVFRLRSVSPNPVRDHFTVEYNLPQDERVRLDLYDIRGKLVRQIRNGWEVLGPHRFTWTEGIAVQPALPSGVYFLRLRAGARTETRRVVLLR